ncbi:MAG: histidine kinase dimerization/phospho-acceptor domain-containing protein [Eubacterium ramulus]
MRKQNEKDNPAEKTEETAASADAGKCGKDKASAQHISHDIRTPMNAILGYSKLMCRSIR